MFPLIDPALAWARILKGMGTLSFSGLSASWGHAEDPRILGIMTQMLHCFVANKKSTPFVGFSFSPYVTVGKG